MNRLKMPRLRRLLSMQNNYYKDVKPKGFIFCLNPMYDNIFPFKDSIYLMFISIDTHKPAYLLK